MSKKALFCWSGGKDSSYCLHKVLTEKQYDVCYLLTTLNANYRRISMHGIKEELLDVQVKETGIPLLKIFTKEGTNKEYEELMESALFRLKDEGINHVIFGDIFLDDLREYREKQLARVGMTAVFPLWKMNTKELAEDFINKGFKTIICCVNDGYLDINSAGRIIDEDFINNLPTGTDPCGENGEYHSFCFEGPVFKNTIQINKGETIYRPLEIKTTDDCPLCSVNKTKGFWYTDINLSE